MSPSLPARWLACLTSVVTISGALAQAAPPPAVATEPFRSALDGYRPFNEEKIAPWKESNDTVGRIGGWRVYAKEAQGTQAQPPASPAVADPHAGHGEKAK